MGVGRGYDKVSTVFFYKKCERSDSMGCILRLYFRGGTHKVGGVLEVQQKSLRGGESQVIAQGRCSKVRQKMFALEVQQKRERSYEEEYISHGLHG